VNGRRAKLSGLNADHESAPSRLVADETRVCLPFHCCSSALEKRTNDRPTDHCYAIAIDYGATGLDLPVPRAVVPTGEQTTSSWFAPDCAILLSH
jgi:hypothetical protein